PRRRSSSWSSARLRLCTHTAMVTGCCRVFVDLSGRFSSLLGGGSSAVWCISGDLPRSSRDPLLFFPIFSLFSLPVLFSLGLPFFLPVFLLQVSVLSSSPCSG